ncbi:MAG: hypothetical protein ABSC87_04620 [Halobacteriota archaeon]|jgi:hypothetical protein
MNPTGIYETDHTAMLGQQVIDDDCLTFLQHVVGGEDVATKAATGILTMRPQRGQPGRSTYS